MSITVAEANLAAECRAVEEGHAARFDHARHVFLVNSDTTERTYELTAFGPGRIAFSCTCPAGRNRTPLVGVLACKHQALVARRLEGAGLARFDGAYWVSDYTMAPTGAVAS